MTRASTEPRPLKRRYQCAPGGKASVTPDQPAVVDTDGRVAHAGCGIQRGGEVA